MEQVTTEAVQTTTQLQTGQPAPAAEGTTQEGQTTEQKPAGEVTQEEKEGEEKHRSRAYRRLDRWRTRAIEAEAQIKAYQELGVKPSQQERSEAPVSDEPKREQFESYEDFLRAEARYIAKKEATEAARKEAETLRKSEGEKQSKQAQEKQLKVWNAQVEKARDVIDDFDEVCAESEVPLTSHMSQAIIESDKGALIAYYLAKNPEEAEKISKLGPSKQAAAIVALEDKVSQPTKKPSNAPAPINPVTKTGGEVEKDPAKMSDAEFNAWRRKQIAHRR